jgi:3-oxoacyl-[acyl-carrier-protein] synthase III
MTCRAGKACLRQSAKSRQEIDLVVYTGVYRTEFLSEPAVAAIAAGELGINAEETSLGGRRTFAFDLQNGAAGALSACFVASQLLAAGKFSRALLLASEVEDNATAWPENLLGLQEAASALVLEASEDADGFTAFAFRSFPEHVDALVSHVSMHAGRPAVHHRRDTAAEGRIRECVRTTVECFLQREQVRVADLKRVLLPQRSPAFRTGLAEAVKLAPGQLVSTGGDADYFTSSLAFSFARLRQEGLLSPGDLVLVVEVAAGLQVACALYRAGQTACRP